MSKAKESGRSKFKKAKDKTKKLRSRIKESPHGEAALNAAENDDFAAIVKHGLLRRKSIRIVIPDQIGRNIYEETKDTLDHVDMKTPEQIERERKLEELRVAEERRRIALEELEKQRVIRMAREEKERFEREERERIKREEMELIRKEEEREQLAREAEERRVELERQRQEADERARKERRDAYDKKLAAVMDATTQKERENALREVGKLTMLDFNTQEEWESHQNEVGKLNILEIAGNFKKAGKKKRNMKRRQTTTVTWANAKDMIAKFSNINLQEEVIRFVKPTAVDLSDLDYRDDNMDSPFTDRSDDSGITEDADEWSEVGSSYTGTPSPGPPTRPWHKRNTNQSPCPRNAPGSSSSPGPGTQRTVTPKTAHKLPGRCKPGPEPAADADSSTPPAPPNSSSTAENGAHPAAKRAGGYKPRSRKDLNSRTVYLAR